MELRPELNQKLVDDPTFSAWLINRTPNRRWGEVEELAPAAVFLASDAAGYITGVCLPVDGGLTCGIGG